jgi:4-amino-4-deoxy-L-arabinose transferase-like glycosyltransferase
MTLSRPSRVPPALDVLVAAVVGFAVLRRFDGAFGFYEDEGYNLVKAYLVTEGFSLYREIYSDQAPLFTWVLALPMALGAGEPVLRAIPPLFGVGTLLAARALVARLAGRVAGLLVVAVLLCLAPVLKFFASLVINTPALALGSWAVVLAIRHGDGGTRASAPASGLLLGAALITKLATLYLAPVILLALVLRPAAVAPAARARTLLLWAGMALLPVVLVAPFVPGDALVEQLLRPHTVGLEAFARHTAIARQAMLLAPGAPWLYAAGALALPVLWWRAERRLVLVLGAWLGVMTLWVLLHRPLWSHHLPDFLLPLAVVAVTGGVLAWRAAGPARLPVAVALCLPGVLLATGTLLHARDHGHWRRWYDNASEGSLRAVAAAIADQTAPGDQVLVDRPILAYWARRAPPPWLALLLRKRIASGGLDDAELVRALDQHHPALIALCTDRLAPFPSFQAEVARRYRLVARFETRRLFAGSADGLCRLHRRL